MNWLRFVVFMVPTIGFGIAVGWLARAIFAAHHYLSTACFHGEHEHCRSTVSAHGGTKVPGQCKFCDAICRCRRCRHTDQTEGKYG